MFAGWALDGLSGTFGGIINQMAALRTGTF
jgi:hypothetical protein